MKKLFFLLVCCLSLSAFAEEARQVSHTEKFESAKIWAGLPAGVFFGFGLGHGLQDRYVQDYGWAYTVAESIGLGMIMSTYGDCFPAEECAAEKERTANTGRALYMVAHAIEIADVSIWSYKYYNRHSTAFLLTPKKDGAAVTASISF
jgi:hypothetical protein